MSKIRSVRCFASSRQLIWIDEQTPLVAACICRFHLDSPLASAARVAKLHYANFEGVIHALSLSYESRLYFSESDTIGSSLRYLENIHFV